MKYLSIFLAATAAFLAAPSVAQEANPAIVETSEQSALELRAEQVIAVLNGETDLQEIFTEGFLTAVPPAQLEALSTQITQQFGQAVSVESVDPPTGTRAAFAIRMERAIARGGIAIDASDGNRISELLFQNFEIISDTPEKIEADLSALPGETSWWFGRLDGERAIMAHRQNDQMAIGSTFKLYVLAALAREVALGKRNWQDVVTLGEPRSFPSGMMQDWPEDAAVTLETLASLMVSVSDNTATDALIDLLGRQAIMQAMIDSGHRGVALNDPFLKTRELFLLKGGPKERMQAYQVGDSDERSQILAQLEDIAVEQAQIQSAFSAGPIAIDVEWFASADDLANLFRFMRETADPRAFEIMAINTSTTPTARANWKYVGYKGGSEPGVLNLTYLLKRELGAHYALVLSWNNPDANLDETALELIAQRILSLPVDVPVPAAP